MKIYEMYIIDFFLGCFSIHDIDKQQLEEVGFDFKGFEGEFLYRLSKETNWEGDGELLFFPIMANKDDGRLEYGAVIKQQNNGCTWVAIPSYVSEKVIHFSEASKLVVDTNAYMQSEGNPWDYE